MIAIWANCLITFRMTLKLLVTLLQDQVQLITKGISVVYRYVDKLLGSMIVK